MVMHNSPPRHWRMVVVVELRAMSFIGVHYTRLSNAWAVVDDVGTYYANKSGNFFLATSQAATVMAA